MLNWVRLDCHNIQRLCRNHGHVYDDRMWCGQRLRGWWSATSQLYMQSRLFVDVDHNRELRWWHRHVHHVWGRLQLCRERRPGGRVYRRRTGVLLWCWLESI